MNFEELKVLTGQMLKASQENGTAFQTSVEHINQKFLMLEMINQLLKDYDLSFVVMYNNPYHINVYFDRYCLGFTRKRRDSQYYIIIRYHDRYSSILSDEVIKLIPELIFMINDLK
jgi:hypothetical protein